MRVAVQRWNHRIDGYRVAVLHAVFEEFVQRVRRGRDLRKQARDDAGRDRFAKKRPHDRTDSASTVAVRQSRTQEPATGGSGQCLAGTATAGQEGNRRRLEYSLEKCFQGPGSPENPGRFSSLDGVQPAGFWDVTIRNAPGYLRGGIPPSGLTASRAQIGTKNRIGHAAAPQRTEASRSTAACSLIL